MLYFYTWFIFIFTDFTILLSVILESILYLLICLQTFSIWWYLLHWFYSYVYRTRLLVSRAKTQSSTRMFDTFSNLFKKKRKRTNVILHYRLSFSCRITPCSFVPPVIGHLVYIYILKCFYSNQLKFYVSIQCLNINQCGEFYM